VLGAAAAQGLTLVICMGMARLDTIVAGLAERLPADTPAAIVMGAATSAQRELLAPLARLPAAARAAGIGSPAIVGDVLWARDGLLAEPPSRQAPGRVRAA
jgi:uroporphyrin-III C-methyltransferase